MLVNGFGDDRLIHILKFLFVNDLFFKKLKKQFPNGNVSRIYLGGANVNHSDFMQAPKLKIIYLVGTDLLKEYKHCINKKIFEFLKKMSLYDHRK